jgi:hypothetical protein
MPTFQLTLAYDLSVYGSTEVEADNLADAIEKVRDSDVSPDLWDQVYDSDSSDAFNYRVVEVGDAEYNVLATDIQISEPDGQTTLPAEVVLANLTASIISN